MNRQTGSEQTEGKLLQMFTLLQKDYMIAVHFNFLFKGFWKKSITVFTLLARTS